MNKWRYFLLTIVLIIVALFSLYWSAMWESKEGFAVLGEIFIMHATAMVFYSLIPFIIGSALFLWKKYPRSRISFRGFTVVKDHLWGLVLHLFFVLGLAGAGFAIFYATKDVFFEPGKLTTMHLLFSVSMFIVVYLIFNGLLTAFYLPERYPNKAYQYSMMYHVIIFPMFGLMAMWGGFLAVVL